MHITSFFQVIIKVQRVQLTKYSVLFIVLFSLISCSDNRDNLAVETTSNSEVKMTRNTQTINASQLTLEANKGLVYYNDVVFTGTAQRYYANETLAEEITYVNGVKDGTYKKWFEDGLLSFESSYTNGKQQGVTKSWWSNGKLRSESNYVNGLATGIQRQWYISGERLKERNLVNGKEEGLQRTWRRNGKLYNNYEAKNGRIFGLKRANLCYSLQDEEVQYKIL